MNLEKTEKKFRANYQFGNARESGSGGFILSDGSIVVTTNHAACCERMGMKLADILEVGLCRYMFRVGQQGNVAVFEYYNLTPKQKNTIHKMLKANDYYIVVTEKMTVNRNRPIRGLNF